MNLLNVIIPESKGDEVYLDFKVSTNGLFLVFNKEDGFFGFIMYNPYTERYELRATTDQDNTVITGYTLQDFYENLQNKFKGAYLKYVKTL